MKSKRIPKIDFRFGTPTLLNYGLRMDFAAGTHDGFLSMEPVAVSLSESAFGYIEPCVTRCWPAYSGYAHWGITPIPVDAWRRIVQCMRALQANLVTAGTPVEFPDLGFILAETRLAYVEDFEATRDGIVTMIEMFVAWLESQFDTCDTITIGGV